MMAAPYDKQTNESGPAFAAFVVYRSMGSDRSTAKVAQSLGKTKTLMDKWSGKHRWVKRASAWDAHVDEKLRNAEVRALEKMRERQISMAGSLQALGAHELRKALNRAQTNPGGTISIKELVAIIESGTRLERVNRGEPSEIVRTQEQEQDLSALSTDELRALKAIHTKLRGGPGETEESS